MGVNTLKLKEQGNIDPRTLQTMLQMWCKLTIKGMKLAAKLIINKFYLKASR